MSKSTTVARGLAFVTVALLTLPGLAAMSHSTAPIGKIATPTGKIDTSKVPRYVFPLSLQALKKTGVTAKDTWGTTTSSSNAGNYPAGYPIESDYNSAFRLRYFVTGNSTPSKTAVTVECSETKDFSAIHATATLTPVDGVIKTGPGAFNMYVVKGREFTGQNKTWYLRARQGDKTSNNVAVELADLIH